MASAPPRVKLITIDGLFRQYDHRIPLNLDERVTVLHGRNGVGKTVTLSMVAALLQGNYSKLTRVPFGKLRINFTDGSFVSVGRVAKGGGRRASVRRPRATAGAEPPETSESKVHIEYGIAGGPQGSVTIEADAALVADAIARNKPEALLHAPGYPGSADTWFDRHDGVMLSAEAVVERYANLLTATPASALVEPQELRQFRRQLPVHFVEAQRLYGPARPLPSLPGEPMPPPPGFGSFVASRVSAVKDLAQDMAGRIKEVDSTYRSTSTRLDDSLPARLFAPPKNGSTLSKKELTRRIEALERERRRLHEIGLLADTTSFNPSTLNDTQRAMFVVYLKDNEEKLAVFKDLADRAEILLGTLNRKLAPKQIKLDKDEGYKVLSHDGRPLDLDDLSSGEQHQLVLLHNLLFRVAPGALLLIDEPELSLHVTWQSEFLSELIQIAKKVGFDALVATHSPYIVGDRRDLMVRLGEPV